MSAALNGRPLYAWVFCPPRPRRDADASGDGAALGAIARDFSPRVEEHRDGLVSIDVGGLERLIGSPRTIGEELRRAAAARGLDVHVAIAGSRSAALVAALARPGLTVVEHGGVAVALAPVPVGILEKIAPDMRLDVLTQWGIRTLGELAALPAAEVSSRLGWQALGWQATARGVDPAPLVPTPPEERFEAAIELEWPIEELEPLSFVLTRLLEPLSARLERRDRGAAVIRTELRLVTRDLYSRSLQLPSPMRDARTLRTLILLDLESHPPPAAIDGVVIAVEPTPGRVVQHTLFARARPTPERLSTLVARLTALMGQTRVGAAATVDSYRPGAFELVPFPIDQPPEGGRPSTVRRRPADGGPLPGRCPVTALRRCRHPVPARAVVEHGVPIRVTTDRRGFAGGKVVLSRGPWRTSGNWWRKIRFEVSGLRSEVTSNFASDLKPPTSDLFFDRDEWDVALGDGGMYRVYRDRETNQWFIDAVVD